MTGRGKHEQAALAHAMCSLLLRYPAEYVLAALPDVRAAVPRLRHDVVRNGIAEFTAWLGAEPSERAAEHYVQTFDLRRRCCLYLSYYRHGDTRARGMALLALKHTYRHAGYEPPEDELPDYLPLMLEFATRAPDEGIRVLVQCQAGIELLHRGLAEVGSPYARLVEAVDAGLPRLGHKQRTDVERLARDGPPTEEVGLEPFAPPEFLTGSM